METKYVANLCEDELSGILKAVTSRQSYRAAVAVVIYDRPDDNTAPVVEIWSSDMDLLIMRLNAVELIVEMTLANILTGRQGLLAIERKALDAAKAEKSGRVVIKITRNGEEFRITDITS